MKLRFIDWEIEKEFCEDYWGYDYRYYLEEIIHEEGSKVEARTIIATNKFEEIIKKVGELALSENNEIEFVKNQSLMEFRYNFKENK